MWQPRAEDGRARSPQKEPTLPASDPAPVYPHSLSFLWAREQVALFQPLLTGFLLPVAKYNLDSDLHINDKETEALGGEVTRPRSHRVRKREGWKMSRYSSPGKHFESELRALALGQPWLQFTSPFSSLFVPYSRSMSSAECGLLCTNQNGTWLVAGAQHVPAEGAMTLLENGYTHHHWPHGRL